MLRKIVIVAVLLVAAYLIYAKVGNNNAPVPAEAPQAAQPANLEQQIVNAVASLNSKMPMTAVDGALRVESAAMKDGMLHMSAAQVNKPDEQNTDKEKFEQYAREAYCKGALHSFAVANIPVRYTFTSPPQSLDDLSVHTWSVNLQPADCG